MPSSYREKSTRSLKRRDTLIVDDSDAKSFYGAVCAGIKKSTGVADVEITDAMGELALNIKWY